MKQLRLSNFLNVVQLNNHKAVIQITASSSQAHTTDHRVLSLVLLSDLPLQVSELGFFFFFELGFIVTGFSDEETEDWSTQGIC